MTDHAYDISYLLESEPAKVETRDLRITKAPPVVPARPSVAAAQEALARELMQAAEAHEALIQQYLQISGKTYQEACAQ
ncbi:hypothetical protein [Rhodanobacter sp. C05]|uniref:hypothetical protein n=1 Tax=Rhodanobacter sp. C05 TaxID=1945855 RepID=UPI000986D2BA|nr:hypothetical protein [Rhodanobacter sp. C05]OOG42600.1 hypothetical protein B0E51_03820 [Rhodanobacter sp. C05]